MSNTINSKTFKRSIILNYQEDFYMQNYNPYENMLNTLDVAAEKLGYSRSEYEYYVILNEN